MILNKETAIGLYSGCRKPKTFEIFWSTGTTTITAYTAGQPIGDNANDRPRINTFRTDATSIIYMSAGQTVWDPVGLSASTPWGDRRTGTEVVDIALHGSLSAGVDVFIAANQSLPVLTPTITQWISSISVGTILNPQEYKFQYLIDRNAARSHQISVVFPVPAAFVQITNISSNTTPEYVTVQNLGGTNQDMTGWYMYSHDGTTPPTCPLVSNQLFRFPNNFILSAGQTVNVQSGTGAADNLPTTLRWTGSFIWNDSGDICTLYNASSALTDTYIYGACTTP